MNSISTSQQRLNQPKGFWVELAPNGEKLYCHNAKINGKKIAIKKTLKQIANEMEKINK